MELLVLTIQLGIHAPVILQLFDSTGRPRVTLSVDCYRELASLEPSATRGERIHHGVTDHQSLVAATLLSEFRVPTIPPQDVVEFETVGFRLR